MTTTVTEIDTTTVENLDFDPPCGFAPQIHTMVGTGTAVWVVRFYDPSKCGCPFDLEHNPTLMCDGCWTFLNSAHGFIRCTLCGKHSHLMHEVESVEPLR